MMVPQDDVVIDLSAKMAKVKDVHTAGKYTRMVNSGILIAVNSANAKVALRYAAK